MKSIERGTFEKFVVQWKHVSNHARLLLFFYLIFIILNPIATADLIREPKLEVVVDSLHKEVSPEEDAIFYWTVYNNESFITIEVSVQSEPKTEFSESSFSLVPGEKREVTQTIFISDISDNSTNLSCEVLWSGMVEIGATSGTFTPWSGRVNVSVVNGTEPVQTFQHEIPNPDTPFYYMPILMMSSILLIYIMLIIIRKKLISQKRLGKKKDLSNS